VFVLVVIMDCLFKINVHIKFLSCLETFEIFGLSLIVIE